MERRRVLAGIGAAGVLVVAEPLVAACTSGSGGSAAPTSGPSSSAKPDARATAAAIEADLVSLAVQVQARWPATTATLLPLQAAHSAHVTALVGTTPSPTAPSDASGTRPAGTLPAALRGLAKAERAAAASHAAGALGLDATGARLLASIAGYAAAQDLALTTLAADEAGA